MEVNFTPELEGHLLRIASEQGRNAQALVLEAVERLISHEQWFAVEVHTGLAAADRGEFVEHGEVRNLIDSWFPA